MGRIGERGATSLASPRAALVELAAEARAVDVASFETGAPTVALHASTLSLTERALVLLDALTAGAPADATEPTPLVEIADIAFLGAAHLRSRLRVLVERDPADRWAMVSGCGSLLRHVVRTLAAVEDALVRSCGGSRSITLDSELTIALQLRRRFADLRKSVGPGAPLGGPALERQLRQVGGAIAVLIGKPIYAHARIPDRVQLRALQARVLAWLREKGSGEAGNHLLQDAACFFDMLRLISRRQELVAHDAELVERALRALDRRADVPEELVGELARLRGRDDEVDALLARAERAAAPWRRALEALADRPSMELLS